MPRADPRSSASRRTSPPTPRARRPSSPSAATRPSPRSRPSSPARSTASTIAASRTSRTRSTTPRASSSWRATAPAARRLRAPAVTTFVFRVRNVPAALYKALGGFATNGVNMTKLESYMVGGALHRDAVLCRRRRHARGPPAGLGARGAALLLARGEDPGHLSGPPLPRGVEPARRGLARKPKYAP